VLQVWCTFQGNGVNLLFSTIFRLKFGAKPVVPVYAPPMGFFWAFDDFGERRT
jgi:hypothetical protein